MSAGRAALWILVAAVPAPGCSGASHSGFDGGAGGGSTSYGSSSGPSSSGGSGGGTAEDSGGSGGSGEDASGGTLNTQGWTCPSSTVFGGYSSACVSCLEQMCVTQLQGCMTGSCQSCEGPVFTCETQSCESPCTGASSGSSSGSSSSGSSGGSSGTTSGEGGVSSTACAGLSTCCPFVAAFDSMLSTDCSSTASSGNEASCQQFINAIAMVSTAAAAYCQ